MENRRRELRTANLISQNTNVSLAFYSNEGPDAEGENTVGGTSVSDRTGGVAEARLPVDLRGKWLTATATRLHFIAASSPRRDGVTSGDTANTSEMSNAVQVQ
jgi:hypothetical protein